MDAMAAAGHMNIELPARTLLEEEFFSKFNSYYQHVTISEQVGLIV